MTHRFDIKRQLSRAIVLLQKGEKNNKNRIAIYSDLNLPHTSVICFDNLNDPVKRSEYNFSPFKSLTAIFELFKIAFLKTGTGLLFFISEFMSCWIFDSGEGDEFIIIGFDCAVDESERRIKFARLMLWIRSIFQHEIFTKNDETDENIKAILRFLID
jgi:hypothetical protein